MEVIVSNKIVVKNPTSELLNYCRGLRVANPEFHKKERMGLWLGNTPRDIVLYEKMGDTVMLPFGCLNYVWRKYQDTSHFKRDISPLRPVDYQSNIKLYPYQEKVVNEAICKKNGIIVMPCGAGKTQTGLELINRIGGRTLWLTHTQDLLTQSMNRAKSVFGLDRSQYGTITGGKVNIGSAITFATVQTMCKIDLTDYKYAFDVVIVDECHKAIGSPTKCMQFYKVLSNLACRYKYGLTATPKRADGLEQTMFALLGNTIAEVDREAVADTTCPIKVQVVKTNYIPDEDIVLAGDGTLNYSKLVDDLVHNENRFDFILQTIKSLPKKQPLFVLANRVEYLERLCDAYNDSNVGIGVCLSGMGTSKSAKEQRRQTLTALNNGNIDCVFATYQLAKEGLDVPNLRYVVFATPEKDPTTVIQSVGRVGRKADGKEYGTVIDFEDNFGMYHGWQRKRLGFYKRIKAEIIL